MEEDNLLSEIVDHISYLTPCNQRLILSEILLLENSQEQNKDNHSHKPNK